MGANLIEFLFEKKTKIAEHSTMAIVNRGFGA